MGQQADPLDAAAVPPPSGPAAPGGDAAWTPAAAEFWRALHEQPWKHDFYMTLRRIECLYPNKPRLGDALRPADEPIRLGQTPALDFAPAPLSAFEPAADGRPPRLAVRFFGLFGPNGPLPLHLTDYARERLLARDPTLARFADVFHHRLILMFYRAWAQAQPTVHLDRWREDKFADYVGALIGFGSPALHAREAAPDHTRLYFAGRFATGARNAEGLSAILSGYFRQPARVESFVGHWLHLPESERTRLSSWINASQQLGGGVVLGKKVWDRQHKFRIHIGPLDVAEYEAFLPGGRALPALVGLVRDYLCDELDWDVRLVLRAKQVPPMRLGRSGRLGWTSWLGQRRTQADADSLTLEPERLLRRLGSRQAPKSRKPNPINQPA